MSNKGGHTDKDLGAEKIFKEIEELKHLQIKFGIPEGEGENKGVGIAQYAAWNEFGVMNKDNSDWYIPPRPFIKNTLDGKREKIQQAIGKFYGDVVDGKATAKEAVDSTGIALATLVKNTIKEGGFEPNSQVTIHGSEVVVVGKETKISKSGKVYTKTIKKQFIEGKKSTKPLIDTGAMRNAIGAVTLRDGTPISKNKAK